MPIEPVLALWSDRLFMAAAGVYVLAMVLHAVEAAAMRSAPTVATAAHQLATPATVSGGRAARSYPPGVRAGRSSAPASGGAGPEQPRARTARDTGGRTRADRAGRMAVSLTVLAVLLHAGSIVARGLAADRWPLGNMYEFSSAIGLAAVLGWLVVLHRMRGSRTVGFFVLLPVVVLMFLAGTVLYAQAAPVQPALQSYWLVIHVTTISLSSGLLLVAGVASLLYLARRGGHGSRVPEADALDRLAYRVTIVAFPLYTFAVITGAIWAEAAWGRFWGWDPKETVAFVAWVIYATYLHARATAGWRTRRAAWINVAGFVAIAFNFFFINLVVAGLHSYAGVG